MVKTDTEIYHYIKEEIEHKHVVKNQTNLGLNLSSAIFNCLTLGQLYIFS